MCGIAGALGSGPSARVVEVTRRLTRALAHRGPDGEAFWVWPHERGGRLIDSALPSAAAIAVGHRRLSIVDLVTGDQPMSNEDGTVWVTLNGEIYNQRALRAALEKRGHHFRTTADTEVLVHGWEEWGDELFGRLNGIFALVLVDTGSQEVILARDPAGVKPLYVGVESGITWWGSELGPAVGAGIATGAIDDDAVKLFLLFRFVPSPRTIRTRAWKVPPSHYLRLSLRDAGYAPDFKFYASTIRSAAEPRSEADWCESLGTELEAAVARQLMSDVAVGSLLSGGVDSSVVTALMGRHLDQPPQAFGVGFASEGARNEVALGASAARELRVPFEGTQLTDNEYLAAWPASFARVGEPIGNSGGWLVEMLCRTVRRSHKVVLSGQGADEPLGGYPRHMVERLRRLGRFAPGLSALVAGRIIGGDAGNRLRRVVNAPTRLDRYLEIFTVVPAEAVDGAVRGGAAARDLGREAVARWMPAESSDALNDLLQVDSRLSLADDLLIVADHFSMASSVELRVPFLDLEFLDLVGRMPSRFKISRLGERKWLYRRSARAILPPALGDRLCGWRARLGGKLGFATPVDRWFSARGGPLADAAAWAGAFGSIAGGDRDGFGRLTATSAHLGVRGKLALYSLSQWLQAQPA